MSRDLISLASAVGASNEDLYSVNSATGRSGENSGILDWKVDSVAGIGLYDSNGNSISGSDLNTYSIYFARLAFLGEGPNFSDIKNDSVNFAWNISGGSVSQYSGYEVSFSPSGDGYIEGQLVDGFNNDAGGYGVYQRTNFDVGDETLT